MEIPLWQAALLFIGMLWLLWSKITGSIRFTFKGELYFWFAIFGSITVLCSTVSALFK